MDDLNNYVVLGVRHYNELLEEIFTLRQRNTALNNENSKLLHDIMASDSMAASSENLEESADVDM